jgi:phage N-6-adenine-methyltransferase
MATSEFWSAAFSSNTGQWDTPIEVVNRLAQDFTWDVDVCSNSSNVCPHYYDEPQDGLVQHWTGLCWMNPPYGRRIGQWVTKAWHEPGTVVCLLPARTDTKWWQDTVPYATLVVFIQGRLTFGSTQYWQWVWDQPHLNGKPNSLYQSYGKRNSAPFPSAFVVFGPLTERQLVALCTWGWSVSHKYNGGLKNA